jgi:hypothetical protein
VNVRESQRRECVSQFIVEQLVRRIHRVLVRPHTIIFERWIAQAFLPRAEIYAAFARQQPDGDDTPGIAMAPVAFAGAIIPGGLARFIVMLSAHADVFGVGITVRAPA